MPGRGSRAPARNAGSVATPNGTFDVQDPLDRNFSLKARADPQFTVNPIRSLPAVAAQVGHAFFHLPDRYGANTGTGEYDMMGSAPPTRGSTSRCTTR